MTQASLALATADVTLSPAQDTLLARLTEALSVSPIVGLTGAPGTGKTRVAQALAARTGGRVIGLSDVYLACRDIDPTQWEEAVAAMVLAALDDAPVVVLDDFADLTQLSMRAGLRGGFFGRMMLRNILTTVVADDRRLVLTGAPPQPWQSAADLFGEEAAVAAMPDFTSRDYAAILQGVMGTAAVAGVDMGIVFRYASMLNGYQLTLAGRLLAARADLDAVALIDCLQDTILFANTRMEEVEALSFDTLPGSEGIVEELETHLILPFENRELAARMGLKPKRGVLLHGPPGTGKTSIGRALAHRIKGKFFLIDGSYISEPPGSFFQRIQNTVQEAKENSPSVLFIDDADVLFGIQHISGLVRYLLSLLDGLESETASNVCVMMTAMDVSRIPDALLRSGRVELWLETKAPDAAVRELILKRWMGAEMPDHEQIDYALLAEATEGFTAADLRRIAGDAKSLYAADIVAGRPTADAMTNLAAAVNEIVAVRRRMADLLGDPALRIGHPINRVATDAPPAAALAG